MSNDLHLELHGIHELIRKLNRPDWTQRPTQRFLDNWRYFTQHRAVRNMKRGKGGWIDSGDTRRSITSQRDTSAMPYWARVGSNKPQARWGELGTGRLSVDPKSRKQAYFPPPLALQNWAIRHGFKDSPNAAGSIWRTAGGKVSRIIHQQGGTEPRFFLRDAFNDSKKQMPKFLNQWADDLGREAGIA